jgi:CRP-like cAMP-binding protein
MALRKNTKVDLLEKVPLLSGCSKRELGEIATIADELDIREGTTLMQEGASGREFIVLVEGTAKVTRGGRTIAELGAGDWAGEIALVANVPRTATVTAQTPLRTLVITDREFRRLLERHPSISTKVLQKLGERMGHDQGS